MAESKKIILCEGKWIFITQLKLKSSNSFYIRFISRSSYEK